MENEIRDSEVTSKKKFKINRKTLLIIIIVLVVIGLAIFFKKSFIAATVNGQIISKPHLIKQLEKQSGKQTLENLVIENLINQEADKQNIKVATGDIDAMIKQISDQLVAQGDTLDAALASQGITLDDLKRQLTVQKKLELLLADKITVSDEEIAKFMEDNKLEAPEGKEVEFKEGARAQIAQQKLTAEVPKWVTEAKSKANINYYVKY